MTPHEPMLIVGGPFHGAWTAVQERMEGKTVLIPQTFPLVVATFASDPRFDDMSISVHEYRVSVLADKFVLLWKKP